MPLLKREPEPSAEPKDAWSLEAEAEHELFQAQQMRRTMQAEVWAGAGLLGCLASVVAAIHRSHGWTDSIQAVGEGLLLWGAVGAARRWASRAASNQSHPSRKSRNPSDRW